VKKDERDIVTMAVRRTVRHLACLVLLGLTIAGCAYDVGPPAAADLDSSPAQSSETTESAVEAEEAEAYCGDWHELADSGLVYQNNVWGKGDIADYEQCLLTRRLDGTTEYGWRWQWPKGTGQVKAYPQVIYGHKPWNPESTTSVLPARIESIKELSIAYAVAMNAQGAYNLAYDIWLTSSNPPTPDTITHEVMIWMARTFEAQPRQYLAGQVVVDNIAYDLYLRPNFHPTSGAGYIAFVSQEPRFGGVVDVAAFLSYLVEHNYVPADSYLASVELGNEVIDGTGELWLQRFQVTTD